MTISYRAAAVGLFAAVGCLLASAHLVIVPSPGSAAPNPRTGAVVYVAGDSIARGPEPVKRDGFAARLGNRLCGAYCGPPTDVLVDRAVGGMCLVVPGCGGGTLVDLWDSILASTPRPTTIIVLVGVNDLFPDRPLVTVQQLGDGFQSLSRRAAAVGVQVRYGTLTPVAESYNFRWLVEVRRAEINSWLRSYFGMSGVVDFDAALKAPGGPHLDPHYDGGDGLHPNALGTVYMADAVQLGQLGFTGLGLAGHRESGS